MPSRRTLPLLAWTAIAMMAPAEAAPARHAVLIVVDGLRPDAIAAADARQLQRLQAGGTSLVARAVETPETLPAHVTMVTGLAPSEHGITHNSDQGGRLSVPTLFRRVRDAGGRTGLYVGKGKLQLLADPRAADVRHGPGRRDRPWPAGDSAVLATAFANDFAKAPMHFALIHLRDPDLAGHDDGWMSEPYLAAVRRVDEAVGTIVHAIERSGAARRTLVLVTADHGGAGFRHSSGTPESWTVPWICWSAAGRTRPAGATPTLLDVAPTVLAVLSLPDLPGTRGQAVTSCLLPDD